MPSTTSESMRVCNSLLCAVTALVGLQAGTYAKDQPLASLVPVNAVAYVATTDVALLDRQWGSTGFARFWQDDEMRDFKTSVRLATRLTPDSDLSTLGVNWEQILKVASGEVCWSLIPSDDQDVGYLLLVDVSQRDEQASALLDDLRAQYAQDNSIDHSTPKVADCTTDVFRIRDIQTGGTIERIYFYQDGVLGVTNREEIARKVLGLLAKTQPQGLVASEMFQIVEKRCRTAAGDMPVQLTWFLDPWAFQALMRQPRAAATNQTLERLRKQGFDVIHAAGGVLCFSTEVHDVEHHWFVFAPGTREKIARMLDFSPRPELQLPSWIPAGIDTVLSVDWNLAKALAGYGSWFDATWAEGEAGTFEAVLEDIRYESDGPQVDIAGLLQLQEGSVLYITDSSEDQENRQTESAYAIKLGDDSGPADALRRMFQTDRGVRLKLVGEHEMWVFADQSLGGAAPPSLGPDFSGYVVGMARGYLFIATSETFLKRLLLQQPATRLSQDEAYQEIHTLLSDRRPDNCFGWQVSMLAAGIGPLYEKLLSQGSVEVGELLWASVPGSKSVPGQQSQTIMPSANRRIDFMKLPSSRLLPSLIPAGYGFASEWDDGWLFDDYVLKFSR